MMRPLYKLLDLVVGSNLENLLQYKDSHGAAVFCWILKIVKN